VHSEPEISDSTLDARIFFEYKSCYLLLHIGRRGNSLVDTRRYHLNVTLRI